MGEIHKLRVKSPYELMKIVDIKIENKPNEHGYLYLKCIIDESINFDSAIKASTKDEICVYEEQEDTEDETVNINEVNERNSKRLFYGIVQNMRTTNVNGIYYLEIQALTSSSKLDIKEKSRSFQNVSMTYTELINEILGDYSGFTFSQNVGKGKKINKPLFQYRETDWSFLKRIASQLNSELYCDIINLNYMFNFGIQHDQSYELEDNIDYDAFKDIKSFYEAGGYSAGYDDTDYFYYKIKKRDIMEIGSKIKYKQKNLYIREYEAYKNNEEIIYKYKLCREDGVWQRIIYNERLKGLTIEGKVLDVEGESVKLHLDIDKTQNKAKAYWFSYLPPSVNIMYSMPLVGESARLYFQNESSEEPIITGCIRDNGDTCVKTSDTTKRYFQTEYGSEIAMLPDALNISDGSKKNISMSFDDKVGVKLKSSKKLSLNANREIIIKTHKKVKINAQSQILIMKRNKSHGVSIESEFYIRGNNVIMNGSSRETYTYIAEGNDDGISNTGNDTIVWEQKNEVYAEVNTDSNMKTGWIQDDGSWYYYNDDGKMATGWLQVGDSWYYLDLVSGEMVTDTWEQDNYGNSYYLGADGQMELDYKVSNEDRNRANAVAYAIEYGKDTSDHDGYHYFSAETGGGSDCTNFVSQCLKAGGYEENHDWNYRGFSMNDNWSYELEEGDYINGARGLLKKSTTDATAAWIKPDALYRYITQDKYCSGVSYITDVSEIPDVIDAISAGDIIAFNNFDEVAQGVINHVAIVTSIQDGKIYYAGHTSERDGKESLADVLSAEPRYNGDIYFVHIKYS